MSSTPKHIEAMGDMLRDAMIVNLALVNPELMKSATPTGAKNVGMIGSATLKRCSDLLYEYAEMIQDRLDNS